MLLSPHSIKTFLRADVAIMFRWLFQKKKMKFKDVVVSKAGRFSIGVEEVSGKYYLSIPVSNRLADYEEYYEITREEFDMFVRDIELANDFANRCRKREMDHLLILKPGADRGVPS